MGKDNYSDDYSKIRKPEYQIALARAERVGLIAASLAAENCMFEAYVQDSFWGPEDEIPERLLWELELQDKLLKELDRLVGHMVNEAIFNHILCG